MNAQRCKHILNGWQTIADELAIKIAEANRLLPPPVVAVEDIVTEGNSYIRARDAANF